MELKNDDPMFPAIKTPEQAARVERTLTEYENEKSRAFNLMAKFFDDYAFEIRRKAQENADDEMGEILSEVLRAIESARDAQETFMRAVIGR